MVHRRSAERMLDVFQRNGGVYIKLGQHMNALVYLLPFEYTDTFEVLQDQCPPTAMKDIRKLIKDETGLELDDLFENFEEKPIGVASLAQVHRATLKSNQRPVAIKLQHPQLQAHAPIDTALCTSVIRIIKSVFPDFELSWLADEMAVTLPQELDFGMEAANLATVRGNFRGDPVFFVPGVFWSTKRILVEEFVYGVKVDDLEGLRMHDIEPLDVSEVLSRVFSKMLFWDGFVHCDPHPGNIIIRPRQRNWYEVPFLRKCLGLNPYNFDLILLDHGLYRSIPSSLRLDFCHLWTSLIRFDESKMKHYAARIFEMPSDTSSPVDKLASDITGDTSTGLASLRSLDEKTTVINKLNKRKFLSAITNIMAVLPREVLLIIKTNDILRSVDRRLGVTGGPALKNEVGNATEGDEERMEVVGKRMVRRFAWMVYYCSVAIRNERMRGAHTLREITEAWLDSWGILARILIMEMVTSN
ncbi:ABC1 family-domain-containing protein [Chytriomyces sp. MP71]|nr:ABC1 family-domain-containing protein [Chytriomyces sp. MP71]